MTNNLNHISVKKAWSDGPAAVCFDVDSTVVTEEGIDILAEHCGAGAEVAAWTAKAMGGSVPFHDALEARLQLIKPSLSDIESCHIEHPLQLTKGVKQLISSLHKLGTHVYLVSGGFRQMIYPLADILNIPRKNVFANNILHDDNGNYVGFDGEEPTSKAGGKAVVVNMLKETHGYQPMFMIGDGATDMEARPPADFFIGFGGIIIRDKVQAGADWFVTDMEDLIGHLSK